MKKFEFKKFALGIPIFNIIIREINYLLLVIIVYYLPILKAKKNS